VNEEALAHWGAVAPNKKVIIIIIIIIQNFCHGRKHVTINWNHRTAATLCTVETWLVSGI